MPCIGEAEILTIDCNEADAVMANMHRQCPSMKYHTLSIALPFGLILNSKARHLPDLSWELPGCRM